MPDYIDRIKALLKRNRWSYQKVANVYGCDKSTIDKWMQRKHAPKLDFIVWVCEKFHVSADWLLGLEGR